VPAEAEIRRIKMVVGLGNPGPRYRRTRHNVGFMVAEELLRRARMAEDRVAAMSLVATARIGDEEVLVLRPQTYMNLSGQAVAQAARRRGIEASEIVLVYDDADLALGRIRLRSGGSPAGHKGVTSVVEALGTREIPRVRLGIGKDDGGLAERVLRPFTKDELPVVEQMIQEGADAVVAVVARGLKDAMNTYNRRDAAGGV
jgi:PTH1 family peptidyl-tRNA hydrolase